MCSDPSCLHCSPAAAGLKPRVRQSLALGRPINNRPQVANLPDISSQAAKIFESSSTEQHTLNQTRRSKPLGRVIRYPGRPIENRPQPETLPYISHPTL